MQGQPDLFTTGGSVQASGGLYLERRADEELLSLCRRGAFAYILYTRQVGKSSLMDHASRRLAEEGIRSVLLDLTKIGEEVTAEEWYLGLLVEIEEELALDFDVVSWWQQERHLGVTHRLTRFFEEKLLSAIPERVVIFVDEIDTTLKLPFTDDFFAAIRSLYLARSRDPELERLSFVLAGVATPNDLIKDPQRTPFNIGEAVGLTDFTRDELQPLAAGLGLANGHAREVLGWIHDWTGGHPYLTLKLCREVAERSLDGWKESDIDALVEQTFFGSGGIQDSNLQFVRDMLTKRAPDVDAVIRSYRNIRRGRKVPDSEQSLALSHLKLSGIVVRRDGWLELRNAIYRRAFDEPWVRQHLPFNLARFLKRAALGLMAILLLISLPLLVWALWERSAAIKARDDADAARDDAVAAREAAVEAQQQEALQREMAVRSAREAQVARVRAEELAKQQSELREKAESSAAAERRLRREAVEAAEREELQRRAAEVAREEAERQSQIAQEALEKERLARLEGERQADIANASRLAAAAELARTGAPDQIERAVLLAAESLRRYPTLEADQSLRRSLEILGRRLTGEESWTEVFELAAVGSAGVLGVEPGGARFAPAIESGLEVESSYFQPSKEPFELAAIDRFAPTPIFAAVTRGQVGVWRYDEDGLQRIWRRRFGFENPRALALRGDRLAVATARGDDVRQGSQGTIEVWSLEGNRVIQADNRYAERLAFDASGEFLAVQAGRQLDMLRLLPDGRLLPAGGILADPGGIVALEFAGAAPTVPGITVPRRLAAAALGPVNRAGVPQGSTIRIWDVKTSLGIETGRRRIRGQQDQDQDELSGRDEGDRPSVISDLEAPPSTSAPPRPFLEDRGTLQIQGLVSDLAFSPDGSLLAVVEDGIVRVWRAVDQVEVARFPASSVNAARDRKRSPRDSLLDRGQSVQVDFLGDGTLATRSSSGLDLWQLPEPAEPPDLPLDSLRFLEVVEISPSGSSLATRGPLSLGSSARVWQLDGDSIHERKIDPSPWVFAYLRDDDLVLSDLDTVRLLPASGETSILDRLPNVTRLTGQCVGNCLVGSVQSRLNPAPEEEATTAEPVMTFSLGVSYLVASNGGWRPVGGDFVAEVPFEPTAMAVRAFDTDYRLAVGASSGEIRFWGGDLFVIRLPDPEAVALLKEMTAEVTDLAFGPAQQLAAGAADGSVVVWELGPQPRRRFTVSHELAVNAVAFSPEGEYLASASDDGTVRVWNVASGREVARVRHSEPVKAVTFGDLVFPGIQYLLSAPLGKAIKKSLWRPSDLIGEACRRVTTRPSLMAWEHTVRETTGTDEAYDRFGDPLCSWMN